MRLTLNKRHCTDFIITFRSFVAGCKLLVISSALVVDGRLVATDSGLHFVEVTECIVWIVRNGPVVD